MCVIFMSGQSTLTTYKYNHYLLMVEMIKYRTRVELGVKLIYLHIIIVSLSLGVLVSLLVLCGVILYYYLLALTVATTR